VCCAKCRIPSSEPVRFEPFPYRSYTQIKLLLTYYIPLRWPSHIPDAILTTLEFNLIFTESLWDEFHCYSHLRHPGTERLGNLPKLTEPVSVTTRTWTRESVSIVWTFNLCDLAISFKEQGKALKWVKWGPVSHDLTLTIPPDCDYHCCPWKTPGMELSTDIS
jgi:hypothetical protein